MECGMFLTASHLTKEYRLAKGTKLALNDVSFRIEEGERVGIIGSNGAGKSTLLSILAGYASATGGTVQANGKISAILDIGTSVQPEMTGRENLVLGGELFGLGREEIEAKLPEIIEFVDIGKYIDYPMKTYSSGMQARISFGIITFIRPEILMIDEALGVGDASFAEKSSRKIRELCAQGNILLIVSHSITSIREFADRCIWLDAGAIRMDGPVEEVTEAYIAAQRERENKLLGQEFEKRLEAGAWDKQGKIHDIVLTKAGAAAQGEPTLIFDLFDDVQIGLTLAAHEALAAPDVLLEVEAMNETLLFRSLYSENQAPMPPLAAGSTRRLQIGMPRCGLAPGVYMLACTLLNGGAAVAKNSQVFRMENYLMPSEVPRLYYTQSTITARALGKGQ